MVCQRTHWDAAWFARWNRLFTGAAPVGGPFVPPEIAYHRKTWEWVAIAQALDERGLLAPGRRGCGFAVGREPLAALFARHGIAVLATDLAAEAQDAQGWTNAGQHAANLDALYWPDIVDRAAFDQHVRFQAQDMRALTLDEPGQFDFIWSACSLEHLGTLEAGLQFVLRSTELLRPGGIAVHTTEFNISSDTATITAGADVLYRSSDIASLAARLRLIGCALERFDPFAGTAPEDIDYDYPPYYTHGRPHVKLLIDGFVSTSCLLIITKGQPPTVLPALATMTLPPDSPWPPPRRGLYPRLRRWLGALRR